MKGFSNMNTFLATYKKIIISTLIITGIIVVAFCLIYGLINGSIADFFNTLLEVLSPVIIGFVIAYLINPIVMFFENRLFKRIKRFTIKRLLSVIMALAVLFAFIAFLIAILIPSIASTLESFWNTYIVNYKDTLRVLSENINAFMDGFSVFDTSMRIDPDTLIDWVEAKLPWLGEIVVGDFSSIFPSGSFTPDESDSIFNIADIITTENILKLLGYVFSLGTSVFNGIKNVLLGLFIAVYMLFAKERCKAGIRRILNSFLSPKHVRATIRFGKLIDRSFGGFIEGQLFDAVIVGVVSYIVFLIFNIPIPHLIATIVAITNVIPIFGPFIGGIPSAILVLITAPEKTILFVILIIVIQQIDGNIICPHILGDKINISSLATIIAIVTMGGLFGIFGMLIGVPVFAVIINIINGITMNSLRKKGIETSISNYYVGDLKKISESDENSESGTAKKKFAAFGDFIKSSATKAKNKINKNKK